jgi:hypothetical protein
MAGNFFGRVSTGNLIFQCENSSCLGAQRLKATREERLRTTNTGLGRWYATGAARGNLSEGGDEGKRELRLGRGAHL